MARTGLSFSEYADLKIKPRADADPALVEAAEMELAETSSFASRLEGATS